MISINDPSPLKFLKIGVHKIKTLQNYKVYEWYKKGGKCRNELSCLVQTEKPPKGSAQLNPCKLTMCKLT